MFFYAPFEDKDINKCVETSGNPIGNYIAIRWLSVQVGKNGFKSYV